MSKKRNISILDYLEQLQLEYLLYELRSKIYPKREDKDKYREIMEYKENKIIDICSKNSLHNIFNSGLILEDIEKQFYDDFGNPKIMTKRDKYFYYLLGADFSYAGKGVKLVSYNFDDQTCVIEFKDKEERTVDLNFIKRIL